MKLKSRRRSTNGRHLSANAVHKTLLQEGDEESWTARAPRSDCPRSLGISIGMSLVARGVLRHHLPDPVADADHQPRLPGRIHRRHSRPPAALHRNDHHRLPSPAAPSDEEVLVNVLRLWAVVFIGNMIGAALFAFFSGVDVHVRDRPHRLQGRCSSATRSAGSYSYPH